MGYVACLGQISEENAHVLQNIVSANGLTSEINDQPARLPPGEMRSISGPGMLGPPQAMCRNLALKIRECLSL